MRKGGTLNAIPPFLITCLLSSNLMGQFISLRLRANHLAHNILEMRGRQAIQLFQDRWRAMLNQFIGAANHFHINVMYIPALQ